MDSVTGGRSGRVPLAVRYVDVIVLALALPAFIAADWPLLGYAVCAAAWLAQHAVLAVAQRRTAQALAAGDRRRALGLLGGSTIGRMWMVTAPILAVGLAAEREDGLAAALLAAVLVTFHLAALAAEKLFYTDAGGAP